MIKKGFTLVELIVTIVLLGVVGGIIIYNVSHVSTTSKENEYTRYVESIKSAASTYGDTYPEALKELYENKSYLYFTIDELISAGYLEEDLKNPLTGEPVNKNDLIKVSRDYENGSLIYEYPVTKEEDESFLVARSEWLMYKEPGYKCEEHYVDGTDPVIPGLSRTVDNYYAALYNENGELILLNDENKGKYQFECNITGGFDEGEPKSGNYTIEYTWVTESGKHKKATRNLRVYPPAELKIDKGGDPYQYYVEVIGGNAENMKLTKQINQTGDNRYASGYKQKDKNKNDIMVDPSIPLPEPFSKVENGKYFFIIDDGNKEYTATAMVRGHYSGEQELTGSTILKRDLNLTELAIDDGDTGGFNTSRSYTFYGDRVDSKVGVSNFKNFRYVVLDNGSSNIPDVKTLGSVPSVNPLSLSFESDKSAKECNNSHKGTIYFRVMNDENFMSDWIPMEINITNSLEKLMVPNKKKCKAGKKCCEEYTEGGTKYCKFIDKVIYVKYGNAKFVILDYNMKTGSFLAAYDKLLPKVTPTKLKKSHAIENTCDWVCYKDFKYNSAVFKNLLNGAKELLQKLPSSYKSKLKYYEGWKASISEVVEYTGASTQWIGEKKTLYKVKTNNSYKYSSYVGIPSVAMVEKYKDALKEDKEYWLSDTYSDSFTVYLDDNGNHQNESTTAYNIYFYSVLNGEIQQTYVAKTLYVKALVRFKPQYIKSGDGSKNNPYILCN